MTQTQTPTPRQAIFDLVKAFATTTPPPPKSQCSLTEDCMYRGPEGSRCFLGALIDDEHYDPDYEGLSPRSPQHGLLVLEAITASTGIPLTLTLKDDYFLEKLQMVHDAGDPSHWAQELTEFALRWDLKP